MSNEETPKLLDIARTIEGHSKHLEFAKTAIEAGWNARNQQEIGFHLHTAIKLIENVILYQGSLAESLYGKPKKGAGK